MGNRSLSSDDRERLQEQTDADLFTRSNASTLERQRERANSRYIKAARVWSQLFMIGNQFITSDEAYRAGLFLAQRNLLHRDSLGRKKENLVTLATHEGLD